jgi:hypothetical protein
MAERSRVEALKQTMQRYLTVRPENVPFSIEAALTWIMVDSVQRSLDVTGDALELGVQYGGSALMILCLLKSGERASFVDIVKQSGFIERTAALGRPSGVWYDFYETKTSDQSLDDILQRRFRLVHIDASHLYEDVAHDLSKFSTVTAEQGILILDDIFQPRWPDVTRATFDFLAQNRNSGRLSCLGSIRCTW